MAGQLPLSHSLFFPYIMTFMVRSFLWRGARDFAGPFECRPHGLATPPALG